MAGCPVTLNSGVNALKSNALAASALITPSAFSSQPALRRSDQLEERELAAAGLERANRNRRSRQRRREEHVARSRRSGR